MAAGKLGRPAGAAHQGRKQEKLPRFGRVCGDKTVLEDPRTPPCEQSLYPRPQLRPRVDPGPTLPPGSSSDRLPITIDAVLCRQPKLSLPLIDLWTCATGSLVKLCPAMCGAGCGCWWTADTGAGARCGGRAGSGTAPGITHYLYRFN